MTTRALKITTCFAALIATAVIGASPAMAAPGSGWTTNNPLVVHASAGSPGIGHTTASRALSVLPHLDHSILVIHKGTVASGGTGFDWADAGIGATTATLVSIVLFGVLLDLRRRRVPTAA